MEGSTPGGGGEDSSILVSLHEIRRERADLPITFHRLELNQILNVYGQMVAEGIWRDYAIDHLADRAVFSVFRRSSEVPLYQIVKCPKLARKQGAWSVIAAGGQVLKRGHELPRVLRIFDRKLALVKRDVSNGFTAQELRRRS